MSKRNTRVMALLAIVCCTGDVMAVYRSWRWEGRDNARLEGHVIDDRPGVSLLWCMAWCGQTAACRTVNFGPQDGRCELNEADDRWADVTSPAVVSGFNYYRRVIPKGPQDVDSAHVEAKCKPEHLLLDDTCLEPVNQNEVSVAYIAAAGLCDHRFGRLAVLDTAELQTVVDLLMPYGATGKYFVDIVRRDGLLVWGKTDTAVDSIATVPWAPDEPNNLTDEDCGTVESYFDTTIRFGFWDRQCDMADRGYMCQYEPWVYLLW